MVQMITETVKERRNAAFVLIAMLFACSLLAVSVPVSEAADDSPEKLDGQKTFFLDGAEMTADAFSFRGMIYVVTDDTQSNETLGLYGVVTGQAEYICNVWIEADGILYEVTSVVTAKDVTDNFTTGGKELYLADSITHLEDGCFAHLDAVNDIFVSEGCTGTSTTGYADVFEVSLSDSVTFDFAKGNITYPQDEYQNQSMDSFTVYEGLVSALPACSFDYPWYELSAWKQGDNAEFASDSASILFCSGKVYVDGVDSGLSVTSGDSVSLTAQWQEIGFNGNRYGDYPIIYMWITCVIIVALFVAGIALVVYRANQRRNAS